MRAAGFRSVADLLLHLPRAWEDRRRTTPVAEALENRGPVLLRGRLHGLKSRRTRRRNVSITEAMLEDESGSIEVVWFSAGWFSKTLASAVEVQLFGPVRRSRGGNLQVVNQEVERVEEGSVPEGRIVPVYAPLGPIVGKTVRRVVSAALSAVPFVEDPLPEDIRREFDLVDLRTVVRSVHLPDPGCRQPDLHDLTAGESPAHRRLAFDELLAFSMRLAEIRNRRSTVQGAPCVVDEGMRATAARMLPFTLTRSQRRVVGEIARDLESGPPMARLLQGDVGCGKTVVAALAMLIALENGHQAALMAPTELLAGQHWKQLSTLFDGTPYRPVLLTGSLRADERREAVEGVAAGRHRCVVGTHALIQESVDFADLGLVVIDEQHRFGTAQRGALVAKGRQPHLLVMTATPIPRSLALTVYGDLDLSVIDELPPGRSPVRTEIRTEAARSRLNDFLREEVAEGGRVFVVFPVIEESDALDVKALERNVEVLRGLFGPERVGMLHGRMPSDRREQVYGAFRRGSVSVLAATTVIEVGIDVPEASVMVIESAERFGLSQLHQLRGRVGRGTRKSWCVVMVGEEAGEKSRERLEVFAATADGFEIAEADLRLRGPGDMVGTRQWGPAHFRFADVTRHLELAARARSAASRLAGDGRLERVRNDLALYHRMEFGLPTG